MKCISKAAWLAAAALVVCGSFAGCANMAKGTSSSDSFKAQYLDLDCSGFDDNAKAVGVYKELNVTPVKGSITLSDTDIATFAFTKDSEGTETNTLRVTSKKAGTTLLKFCNYTGGTSVTDLYQVGAYKITVDATGAITKAVDSVYTAIQNPTNLRITYTSAEAKTAFGLTPAAAKSSNRCYATAEINSGDNAVWITPIAATTNASGTITITLSDTTDYAKTATMVVTIGTDGTITKKITSYTAK